MATVEFSDKYLHEDIDISVFRKYIPNNNANNIAIIINVIVNHLFLKPPINSITNVIIKYIIIKSIIFQLATYHAYNDLKL